MIEICPNCSNVNISQLETHIPDEELLVNCVGQCGLHSDRVAGFINGELVIVEDSQTFIEKAKASL